MTTNSNTKSDEVTWILLVGTENSMSLVRYVNESSKKLCSRRS